MNISTAFNIFVRQALNEIAIPFKIKENIPNETTIKATEEIEQIIKSGQHRFNNADEIFKDLGI